MNAHGFIPASRIIGLLIMLPVLAAIALGLYLYHSTTAYVRRAVTCQGQVVDLQSSQGQNGTMYAPVFTFSDAKGVIHRGYSSESSNPPAYSVGDPIALLYDPQHVDDVRVNSWSLWLGPMICGFLTIPFLIASLVFLLLVPFTIRRVWPNSPPSALRPPPLPHAIAH